MSKKFRLSLTKSVTAFVLVAVGSAVFLSAPAAAYQCKQTALNRSEFGFVKAGAMSKARKAWSAQAKSTYGLAWSVLSIADSKSESCVKSGAKWRCTVSAKPCLYVVP